MKERLQNPKKTESPTVAPERSQLNSRSSIAAQTQPHSQKPTISVEKENQEFQKCKLEVTKLEIQAKHGPLTPEQQKHLTALKAKMKELLHKREKEASNFGHSLNNFAINRPDTSSSKPEQVNQADDKKEESKPDAVVNQLAPPASVKDGLPATETIAQKPESVEMIPSTQENKKDLILAKNTESSKEESLKNESTEDKSTENKPKEDKSTENKPAENKSVKDKSTEDKSTENKPKEDKSIENKPADKKQQFLKDYSLAKELVHNIDEKLPQDKILGQLLKNFGKIDFKYTMANKSHERLLQGAKEGDCQTLARAFKAVAQEYFGITNINIGKISEPFLSEAGKTPHKGYEPNCNFDDGKQGWFFQNHYWAESNGKIYDVLFLSDRTPEVDKARQTQPLKSMFMPEGEYYETGKGKVVYPYGKKYSTVKMTVFEKANNFIKNLSSSTYEDIGKIIKSITGYFTTAGRKDDSGLDSLLGEIQKKRKSSGHDE
jgi:hypothetical protein